MVPYYHSSNLILEQDIYEYSYWLRFINDINVQFSRWALLWFKDSQTYLVDFYFYR